MRWTKARKNINNVKFAELIGVSDKTVTNMLNYETHDRLDDSVVSKIALVLGFKNEPEFIDAYQRGVTDFSERNGAKVDVPLLDTSRRVASAGPKKSPPPARIQKPAKKP